MFKFKFFTASLCRMMHAQSLTRKGCFHIHLPKLKSLSVLIENLILIGWPTSTICDITTSLGFCSNIQQTQVKTPVKCPVHIT